MSLNISTYLEGKWLNMLKGTAYTAPTIYCGIVSDSAADADLEAGTLTNEITGYTGNRPAITLSVPSPAAGKSTVNNTGDIDFVSMPAPAGRQVKYAIVCDAATGGNILYWCPLSAPKSWNLGDTFRIPITTGLVLDLG
jgi:hypothetical protein